MKLHDGVMDWHNRSMQEIVNSTDLKCQSPNIIMCFTCLFVPMQNGDNNNKLFTTLIRDTSSALIHNNMDVSKPVATLPALTFPDTDMMLADVTKGDVEDTFK